MADTGLVSKNNHEHDLLNAAKLFLRLYQLRHVDALGFADPGTESSRDCDGTYESCQLLASAWPP